MVFTLHMVSITVFFQVRQPTHYRFYKLTLDVDPMNPNTMNYTSHITLNKKLPEELICKLLTYLSMKDILHLCISKLFLPYFLHSPEFTAKLNSYFAHLLGKSYSECINLFMICTLNPTIVNNHFYFSVDFTKLTYFKKKLHVKDTSFTLDALDDILKIWGILFQPYTCFKKHRQQYLRTIRSFANCHNLCPCHNYRIVPFSGNSLQHFFSP